MLFGEVATRLRPWAAVLTLSAGLACTDAIDWRTMQPPGTHLAFSMPCRPAGQARRLMLAASEVEMTIYACRAGDTVYSVGSLDAGHPARVGPLMQALTAAASANLQGRVTLDVAARIPGMTPHPASRRQRIVGMRPGGGRAVSHFVVFSYGTQVHQAIALGESDDDDRSGPFFDGLKVKP